jgi:hypothetical protein
VICVTAGNIVLGNLVATTRCGARCSKGRRSVILGIAQKKEGLVL